SDPRRSALSALRAVGRACARTSALSALRAVGRACARTSASAADVRLQLAVLGGKPQLPEGLRLDLANALAREREALANLLERVIAWLVDAEAHSQDLLLAWRQRLEEKILRM